MSQPRSPLLPYANLPPGREQEIRQKKRNVIDEFRRSGFKTTFTLATAFACKLKWFPGNQDRHGHHGGVLSVSPLGTKDPIIARLSKRSPWKITYEAWAYCDNMKDTLPKQRLTFDELRKRLKSGKALEHPFDKAFRDESNAEHNLANLVKWYYMAYHVVDVTDADCSAFAKSLRQTVQSFSLNVPRTTRSQAAGAGHKNAPSTRTSPTGDAEVSGPENLDSRTDESLSAAPLSLAIIHQATQDFEPLAQGSPQVKETTGAGWTDPFTGMDHLTDASSGNPRRDTPLEATDRSDSHSHTSAPPSASPLKTVNKGVDIELLQIDEPLPDDDLDNHMVRLLSDTDEQSEIAHISRQSSDAKNASHSSFPAATEVAATKVTDGPDDTAASMLTPVSPSDMEIAGDSVYTRVERALSSCGLLTFSRAILKDTKAIDLEPRYLHKGYLPQAFRLETEGQKPRIYALLRNKKVNPRLDVSTQQGRGGSLRQLQQLEFFTQQDDDSELAQVNALSFPKKYRRLLRHPFALAFWNIDEDIPREFPKEVHEGGDRLRLLCQHLFLVNGIRPWHSVESKDHETRITSMFNFMRDQEARLDAPLSKVSDQARRIDQWSSKVPGTDTTNDDVAVMGVRTSTWQTQPLQYTKKRIDPKDLPRWAPLEPWEILTPKIPYPVRSFKESSLGSALSRKNSQQGSSPSINAQARRAAHNPWKDTSRVDEQPGGTIFGFDASSSTREVVDLTLATPDYTPPCDNKQDSSEVNVAIGTPHAPYSKKRSAAEMSDVDSLAARNLQPTVRHAGDNDQRKPCTRNGELERRAQQLECTYARPLVNQRPTKKTRQQENRSNESEGLGTEEEAQRQLESTQAASRSQRSPTVAIGFSIDQRNVINGLEVDNLETMQHQGTQTKQQPVAEVHRIHDKVEGVTSQLCDIDEDLVFAEVDQMWAEMLQQYGQTL